MRSDLYSIGALLYEMVGGQPVHHAADFETLVEAIRDKDVRPGREVDPTIPSEIDSWVMRLLRRDPAERPQSVQEVRAKIDLALQALPARPANAEISAYVRQLFAARLPESPSSEEVPLEMQTPEGGALETEEPSSRRWSWWWLVIPLLALLSTFIGLKVLSNLDTAGLTNRPSAAVRQASTASQQIGDAERLRLH